jgi:hypothetical protein
MRCAVPPVQQLGIFSYVSVDQHVPAKNGRLRWSLSLQRTAVDADPGSCRWNTAERTPTVAARQPRCTFQPGAAVRGLPCRQFHSKPAQTVVAGGITLWKTGHVSRMDVKCRNAHSHYFGPKAKGVEEQRLHTLLAFFDPCFRKIRQITEQE